MSKLKETLRAASADKPQGLQQTLIKGPAGGPQLGRTSTEGLQKLAAQSGRPLPPTDPATAQQLGATPQQAAMAGSSANLKSTLQTAASGGAAPTTLQDTLRTQQARTQKSAAELAQEELAGKLKTGTQQATSEDVARGVQAKFSDMTAEDLSLKLSEDYEYLQDGANESQRTSLAKALKGEELSNDDLTAITQIKGPNGEPLANFEDGIDNAIDKLTSLFGAESDVVAQAAAGAVEDYEDFNVADFYENESDIDALAAVLDIPIEELVGTEDGGGMSIGDLQDALAANIEKEYSRTADLVNTANNVNLSPMERAQARKSLRDAGASGVIGLEESEIDSVADSIANADTIEIGGKEITVEKLLSNEYISGLVTNYLEGAEGAEEAISAEGLGDLKDFVDTNKTALEAMTSSMDESVKGWAGVQTHNQKEFGDLADIVGDEVAALIAGKDGMEGLTGFSSDKIDIPLLDRPEIAHNIVADISDPSIRAAFVDASPEVLDQWDMISKGNPQKVVDFKESVKFQQNLKKAKEMGMSPQQAFDTFIGMDLGQLKQKRKLVELGILPISPEEERTLNALVDGNGNLRSDWMDHAIVNSANTIDDINKSSPFSADLLKKGARTTAGPESIGAKLLESGGLNIELTPLGEEAGGGTTTSYSLPDSAYSNLNLDDITKLHQSGVAIDIGKIPSSMKDEYKSGPGAAVSAQVFNSMGIDPGNVQPIIEKLGAIKASLNKVNTSNEDINKRKNLGRGIDHDPLEFANAEYKKAKQDYASIVSKINGIIDQAKNRQVPGSNEIEKALNGEALMSTANYLADVISIHSGGVPDDPRFEIQR